MKLLIISFLAALTFTLAAFASDGRIREIDIVLTLNPDGSATVCERWDVRVDSGTEWYLVRSNLGDIRIPSLSVSENGGQYRYVGEWDIDKSLEQKARTCGIVHKRDGVELCWGVGSYGDHVFEVQYTMTNAVKSLQDYDCLHLQLVSPGLSAEPERVSVSIRGAEVSLGTSNTRAWGFGFEGDCLFNEESGSVEYRSSSSFSSRSSVIALLRFDKGMFHSPSVQDRSFDDVLETALEGSSYSSDEEDDSFLGVLLGFLALVAGFIGLTIIAVKLHRRSILGVKDSEISWCRDIPFSSDLAKSYYTLKQLGEDKKGSSLAGALILRMIYNGELNVIKKGDRVDLAFTNKTPDGSDILASKLYDMMLRASGEDRVLQDKEFSRWSSSHQKQVSDWAQDCAQRGKFLMAQSGEMRGGKYSPEAQQQARNLLGFRMFLKDFTLISERGSEQAELWREYLVYAALYGMASEVAKQLHDINPTLLEQATSYDFDTLDQVLWRSRMLSRSITNTTAAYAQAQAAKGLGGSTSFGGGGGFSGGGFGGGSR